MLRLPLGEHLLAFPATADDVLRRSHGSDPKTVAPEYRPERIPRAELPLACLRAAVRTLPDD